MTERHRHLMLTFTVCEQKLSLTEVIDIAKSLAKQHPYSDIEVNSTNIDYNTEHTEHGNKH